MAWIQHQIQQQKDGYLSHTPNPYLGAFHKESPSPSSSGARISPAALFVIVILAILFFISGLLQLLVRFLIKNPSSAPDKKFKNWSMANITNRASNEGSSMHTGGSISMGEHARRMEEATGVKPSMEEVFAKCHLKKDKSWIDDRAEKAFGEFKRRKTELSELSLSQNENGEGLSYESQHMPDELTIWKEIVPKGKKGALYGLGSIGSNISSKYTTTSSCSISSKETNLEQELVKWQEKVKEQELVNQEQKQKLEEQQKRIESNESMLVALFGKLNMPLPPNFACGSPMQNEANEIGEPSNGDNDDNFDVD